MYKINIVAVGTLKEKYFASAQDEYLKRLKKFCEIKVMEFQERKLSSSPSPLEIEKSLDEEYKMIVPNLKGKIVVCAVEGKSYSSEEFATLISKSFDRDDILTFVIGSSYGLSKKIKENNSLLSVSKMTLPHHLMRVVLEEQIYRAFTILNNASYHK